mmetsp:Transcript_21964/g.48227  ORF Transcript_21964/g.48227 Transcript_21964/m.48227 type:complete len:203 (-) Transcript_21964:206-814(-)
MLLMRASALDDCASSAGSAAARAAGDPGGSQASSSWSTSSASSLLRRSSSSSSSPPFLRRGVRDEPWLRVGLPERRVGLRDLNDPPRSMKAAPANALKLAVAPTRGVLLFDPPPPLRDRLESERETLMAGGRGPRGDPAVGDLADLKDLAERTEGDLGAGEPGDLGDLGDLEPPPPTLSGGGLLGFGLTVKGVGAFMLSSPR